MNCRKQVYPALFLIVILFSVYPVSVYSLNYYSLKGIGTLTSDIAVTLDGGTFGESEISINKTRANVTLNNQMTYDYVDNNDSNVDSIPDKGNHLNFTAQQYGLDSIYDTLVEESSRTDDLLFLYVNTYDGTEIDWTRVGTTPYLSFIDYNSNYIHASKNNYKIGDFGFEDSGLSSGTIQNVTIQIYAKQTQTNNHLEVYLWDGTSWNHIVIHDPPVTWGWINATVTTQLNSWTKIDSAKIYLQTATGAGLYEVDCARLAINYTQADNFQIDLEVQWNNIDFNQVNEILCIYGGTMTSENIRVDVWNGYAWENLFLDLTTGWNNVSVTSSLVSSTFTIRYKGESETFDSTQDSWEIDTALLCVGNNETTYDYVLEIMSQKEYNQTTHLTLLNYNNIERLGNCTIWFRDDLTSVQIRIIDGVITQDLGPLCVLSTTESLLVVVFYEETTAGESNLFFELETVGSNSILYKCLIQLNLN